MPIDLYGLILSVLMATLYGIPGRQECVNLVLILLSFFITVMLSDL